MFKKNSKFINQYSKGVLAILLLLLIFAVGFYYLHEKKVSINNANNSILEKEYSNKKYGFHLTLPSNVYATEDTLSNSVMVIYFIDQKGKDYHGVALKNGNAFAYNFSDYGKTYFSMTIISKNSSAEEDVSVKNSTQDAEKNLERAYEENFLEKTEYLIGQEKVSFYLATQTKPDYLDMTILNMKLPSADAFFERGGDIYHFSVANFFSEDQNEIMGRIETMRGVIKSIKFVN